MALKPVLKEAKEKLQTIITAHGLGNEPVQVNIGALSPEQAIGNPSRQGYALIEGTEVMVEAEFQGSFGQAFTDQPREFTGLLKDVLRMNLGTNDKRAIFIATLNAVMAHLGMVAGTRHCHDEEPEECALQIAQYIIANYGKIKAGLLGLQPAILENLVNSLGVDNVRCTDLNPKNIGAKKFGVEIWDGRSSTTKLINWCDILLATSSTIVNNTFDRIREDVISQGKRLITFGVTGAGVSTLLGIEKVCFQAH